MPRLFWHVKLSFETLLCVANFFLGGYLNLTRAAGLGQTLDSRSHLEGNALCSALSLRIDMKHPSPLLS